MEPVTYTKLHCVTTGRLTTLHSPAGFIAQDVPTGAQYTPKIISDAFQPQHMPTAAISEMVTAGHTCILPYLQGKCKPVGHLLKNTMIGEDIIALIVNYCLASWLQEESTQLL